MKKLIEDRIRESIGVKEALAKTEAGNIEKSARIMVESLASGGKILVFGNGGSAADSQHMAAELVGRFKKERKAIAAIALTTNTSTLTAIANDYGYDVTFVRQVEALGRKGDVAVGISTSGSSKNVLDAIRKARSLGLKAIGILGGDGGSIKSACDVAVVAGSKDTARVQESHIMVIHILCEIIENELFK